MFPIVFVLLVLHGPDGREIDIAVDEITSMHCKMPNADSKLFVEGTNTVISMTDGKNLSVKETCTEVRDQIEERQGHDH